MNNRDHEEKTWDKIFANELKKKSNKIFSSYWREDYYNDIIDFVGENIINKFDHKINIIEVGSGSGKASLLLGNQVAQITLLDISKNALTYAQFLSKKLQTYNINYIHGDMFNTKFYDEFFDFTWNIGSLEHYNDDEIIQILQEMLRITKKGGYIAFGIPNKKSGPIVKAKILTLPFFKIFPGYRLDTERFFSDQAIFKLLEKIGILAQDVEVTGFGSFLPMEMPKFLIKKTKHMFKNNKFLKFYIIKK